MKEEPIHLLLWRDTGCRANSRASSRQNMSETDHTSLIVCSGYTNIKSENGNLDLHDSAELPMIPTSNPEEYNPGILVVRSAMAVSSLSRLPAYTRGINAS